jgi:hypothetical protein
MKRVTLSLAVSIVRVGVIGSFAAMQDTLSPTAGPPTGKTAVVVAKGIELGIHENVRFESIGQQEYIFVFNAREDTVAYLNAYLNRRTRREAPPSLIDESQDASNTQAPRGGTSPQYVKYAVGLIQKYDSNKDGVLTQDEWAKMNQDYSSADMDKDGRITPVELGAAFVRKNDGSSAPQTVAAEEGTKSLPNAQLVWQECKSGSIGGYRQIIHRSKVPGGWLVVLKQEPSETAGPSFTFYPDPQHVWDGTSLD